MSIPPTTRDANKCNLTTITVAIEPGLLVRLNEAAEVMGKPRHFFVNECLRHYLSELAEVVDGKRIRVQCEKEIRAMVKRPTYE